MTPIEGVLPSRKHRILPDSQAMYLPAYMPDLIEFKAGDSQSQESGRLIYDRHGWVGSGWRRVQCRYNQPDYDLKVEDSCHFLVREGGKVIVRVRRDGDPGSVDLLDWEVLHGPALVLALSMQGIWCLHASAVEKMGKTTLFLGDSGSGKSTLAAYLSGQALPGWRRVADDILPVSLVGEKLEAKTGFPQLKLSGKEQPARQLPASLAVERIFILKQVDETESSGVKTLAHRQTATELLRHTAGTRLFAPDLLARHLGFCGQIVGKVPVYSLAYPHTQEALVQVKNLLEYAC